MNSIIHKYITVNVPSMNNLQTKFTTKQLSTGIFVGEIFRVASKSFNHTSKLSQMPQTLSVEQKFHMEQFCST